MSALSALFAALGGFLVGATGLLAAVSARRSAKAAQTAAAKALESSPAAVDEILRREIEGLADAYKVAVATHATERSEMESVIERERGSRERAEGTIYQMRASMAGLRLDLAGARAEISELRTRFEEMIERV